MKYAICTLKSISPYSQSKYHQTPKKEKEGNDDYEKRTWNERLHYDEDGEIFIPGMQFANSIKEAAKFLSLQIPGKGKSTYTKHFEAGVMVVDNYSLGIHKDDVKGEWFHVPSQGQRGGTSRVLKCFPRVDEWEVTVKYIIIDDTITLSAFKKILECSGQLIGIGRFRPRNCGFYGRFEVENIEWVEDDFSSQDTQVRRKRKKDKVA